MEIFWDHDITMDLAASIDEGHVQKFTRVVKEFSSITPLVYFYIQIRELSQGDPINYQPNKCSIVTDYF